MLNLHNFRNRALASGDQSERDPHTSEIHALRSTFASDAPAAGITVFELARIMGTSVEMIERHYGALLDGSGASIATRLAVFEAEQEPTTAWAGTEGE